MEEITKTVVVEAKCENCRFYCPSVYEDDDVDFIHSYGNCRRFPPRRIDRLSSAFPLVEDDYWCGEFKIAKKILQ